MENIKLPQPQFIEKRYSFSVNMNKSQQKVVDLINCLPDILDIYIDKMGKQFDITIIVEPKSSIRKIMRDLTVLLNK